MAAPIPSFPEPLDVETHLVALARGAAPLRRTLAAIAGRLVATRAWERLGYARLRDYAFERAGVSGRQLQDLAHVDGALRERPGVERALVDGRITWTKARLLCRVATREDEHLWLAAAELMTARALAREVRGVDARSLEAGRVETDEDGVEEIPRENVLVRCTTRVKGKWHQARFFASCVTGRSVQPWEVAEAVAAEVLSAIPLEGDSEATHVLPGPANVCAMDGSADGARTARTANVCAVHGSEEGMVPPRRGAPRGAPFLQALVEGLEEADAFEIDARLRRALRLEQRLHCELGPLLLEAARGRLYRRYGFASLGEFAREWLGMSPRKAQALLRLERACAVCPALREAYRAGRLSWAKAHLLVPILVLDHSGPWHAAWVAHAQSVTARRLEDDVDQALATNELNPGAERSDAATDSQTGAPPTWIEYPDHFFFDAPRDVARLFRAVLASVQRRIEKRSVRTSSESEALDAMLEHAFESWGVHVRVPAEHRVFERDGWRCTAPGCSSYGNLHDHHIVFRSAGGSDDLSNRTTLCAWHHLRGVHAGTVRITGRAPGGLRFELGVRPGRTALAIYRSGDRIALEGALTSA